MAASKNSARGFGRTPMPDEVGNKDGIGEEAEQPLSPPLATPVFVDDVELLEFLARYNLHPLAPVSKFEYQLVQVAAGLEQRIRELDPDA